MLLGKRACQRVLDEIVGSIRLAHQRPSVTPQPRDLGFK
jgi:hypothetical protein